MFDPQTSDSSPVDAMLAEMAADGRAALDKVGKGSSPSVAGVVPKMRYTHEAMADMIIAEPWISQNALAARFGYSPGWISTVITSDAFQAMLAARKEELLDPELRATLEERAKALAHQSFRVLQEKLSRPADLVPDNLALRAAELSGKLLGMGSAAPPPPPPATPGAHLMVLAERLVLLGGRKPDSSLDFVERVQ